MRYDAANPYERYAAEHPVGTVVRGKVVVVRPFGVFVQLAPDVDALLEVCDFAGFDGKRYPEDYADYPQSGAEIEATIILLDGENIRLSQRPAGGAA